MRYIIKWSDCKSSRSFDHILLQYARIPEGQSFFEGFISTINGTIEADYELCECQNDLGTDETLIHCGPVNGDACMQGTCTSAIDVITDGVLSTRGGYIFSLSVSSHLGVIPGAPPCWGGGTPCWGGGCPLLGRRGRPLPGRGTPCWGGGGTPC